MARSINRISSAFLRTVCEEGLHSDGNRLYLAVSKTGAKSWRLVYRHAGKRIELGLGSYPLVSLASAREKARDAGALLARGEDPRSVWRAVSKEAVSTPTFGSVALEFIEGREAGWKNPKHRQQWRNTLTTYAAPIWDKPVDSVVLDDVLGLLRPIWTTKHETASRVQGRVARVLDAATVRGLRSGPNPATWQGNLAVLLPNKTKEPKRHHPAMPHADVPAFVASLATTTGQAAKALTFLVHTAARTSEVLGARWDELDLEARLWTIPATRMKADREHRVPLTQPVIELLAQQSRHCELVFGNHRGKQLSNMAMTMLLQRQGLRDTCTVHGFRSSFREWAADVAQAPRDVAEHALAHTVGSEVERAYRRGDALEARRELMARWSAFLTTPYRVPALEPSALSGMDTGEDP